MDFADSGAQTDRTMGGPTTQMWIDPWISHLATKGVGLHPGERATSLDVTAGRISGVQLSSSTITADYYVLAVPLDAAIGLISPQIGALDATLDRLRTQDPDDLVSWMVGIQYYLYEDVPLVRGHLFFPDSPWALTAISQPQFWRDLGIFRCTYGAGDVGGLLSVDISEWDSPGKFIPKTAKQCTRDEIALEVWEQLKEAPNGTGEGATVLTDDLRHSWHLDEDVDYSSGIPPLNSSRLLVHPPGSWAVRPEAGTAIANLVVASDYVRTHTNIASMEGACEAGRRAANAILENSGSVAGKSDVWPLVEPRQFASMKRLDAWLYANGRPHMFELAGIKHAVRAAAGFRRLERMFGLAGVDDWVDQYKATAIIKTVLGWLGIGG